jgi:hypothetical protein
VVLVWSDWQDVNVVMVHCFNIFNLYVREKRLNCLFWSGCELTFEN